MNKSYALIIYENTDCIIMTTTAWKCYRCDLTFKQETHANLHRDICKHESRQIQVVMA